MKLNYNLPPESAQRILPRNWGRLRLGADHWLVQLLSRMMDNNMVFATMVALVLLVFIYNSHQAEKQARQADALRQEIKELKSEYMTLNAQLSTNRQQSEILQSADTLGLRLPDQPPYKLILDTP